VWNVIFSALIALSLVTSAVALFWSVRSARRGAELQRRFADFKPYSKQSLETRLSELEESILTVANRVKMSRVRTTALHASSKNGGGEPDPRVDPEGWRTWQNKQLKTGVVN
jgi:hypothetical protein